MEPSEKRGFKKWTAEDESRLRELHGAGLSLSKIATEMGLTGGQVRGRAWKLGLVRDQGAVDAA